MAPIVCEKCGQNRAVMVRPKNAQRLCKACFIQVFEDEVHETIIQHKLFFRGERIAIGASGGKDSTVLAAVLKTLNERHDYGLDLVLLSIDEGITGYRDDSLETVKRNAKQYEMPLTIVGYSELYGWTMDEVVKQIGKKGNCTYCGVFRRQALDRGAAMLGIRHVVTGHNADDVAETVMMNLLRGDLPRLSRATSILTGSAVSDVKRSKPLKYAYEKEIVLYAHHRNLDYFTTECIYSPEAFRGSARSLIKDLERIRPSALLDVVRSGEDMARLVPVAQDGAQAETDHGSIPVEDEDDGSNGCGSKNAALPTPKEVGEDSLGLRLATAKSLHSNQIDSASITTKASSKQGLTQKMGRCIHCGYLSSQAVCKACVLIAALNTNRPKSTILAERPNDLTTQMHAKLEHLTI